MKPNNYQLVFDLGGTYLKYGIVLNHQLICHYQIPMCSNLDQFLKLLSNIIQTLSVKYSFTKIGFSTPGKFNIQTKTIESISAIEWIHNLDFITKIKQITSLPIGFANDAVCAILAEQHFGHGQNYSNFGMIVLGTGIGSSMIINNQIYLGSTHQSCELGMMINNWQNNQYEVFCSFGNFLKMVINQTQQTITGEQFFVLQQKDSMLNKLYHKLIKEWAILIFNWWCIMDFEIILIGGGISHYKNLIEDLNHELDSLKKYNNLILPKIQIAKFQNHANLIGASLIKEYF